MIRDITPARLDALALWVGSGPAFSATYPDLDAGLAEVQRLAEDLVPRELPAPGAKEAM